MGASFWSQHSRQIQFFENQSRENGLLFAFTAKGRPGGALAAKRLQIKMGTTGSWPRPNNRLPANWFGPKSFVLRILISKCFDQRILPGISC
jgi:hypothetical protein